MGVASLGIHENGVCDVNLQKQFQSKSFFLTYIQCFNLAWWGVLLYTYRSNPSPARFTVCSADGVLLGEFDGSCGECCDDFLEGAALVGEVEDFVVVAEGWVGGI